MSGLSTVAFGLVLGFSLTIPPGPMNALIASRASRSWRLGILTGLGALTSDASLGVVVFLLQASIDLTSYIGYVYVLGAAVMVFLAVLLLRERPAAVLDDDPSLATYTRALVLGLSNPFQIVWWLTAGIAFAYVGGALLFVGLFGAIIVWIVGFPWIVRSGTRRYPAATRWIALGSAVVLVTFAAYFATLAYLVFA